MTHSSVTRLGATALFASVVLSSATPASATCYPVRGWGHDPDKSWAAQKAKAAWHSRVISEYGPAFDHEVGRIISCDPSRKGAGLWSCSYVAQACGAIDNDVNKHPVGHE